MTAGANTSLQTLLASAQLPALPQSAIQLLELSQDPDNGPAEFAVPIEVDPGLTGQVLRFVNSSYFGFTHEISSVKLAISLVGIRTIKNFALWSAVFSLMPNPKCGPFDLKGLWQDSLRRAVFARRFGKLLGLGDAEDLFAAALLQDMALPLLAKERPADYMRLLEARQQGAVRLSDLEREEFGWTHAEAGGTIARGWRLPEAMVSVIENHVDLDSHVTDPVGQRSLLAVSLSALLPTTQDACWVEREKFVDTYQASVSDGAPRCEEFFAAIDKEFEEFAPVLKLSVPVKSLVDILAEEPAAVLQ